jgi:glycerophosphoryl diester phosphodiesterase
MAWSQPAENTHASLVEAMQRMDGVEFDLRLTADNQLVIHHDHIVSIPEDMLEGRPKIVEEWDLKDLEEVGFCSFEKLMSDKSWLVPWQEHSKVACLEIKRSLPIISKDPTTRMARVMELASEMVDEAGIHEEAAVFYAFHRPMAKVAKLSGSNRPWSRLLPIVPRTGSHNSKRFRAAPEFIANSFARLLRSQKRSGAPMMPCAVDYFEGMKKYLHIGMPVGLKGRQLRRLTKICNGFPVYVWPGHLYLERDLLSAGLSILTDNADPAMKLPCGSERWLRPATMPLTDQQWIDLQKGIIPTDVAPWHETTDQQLGWNATRIIGHRGCGKTSRPVIQPM